MQSSILFLLALVSITVACPGLFGMMGGGGGGCGCSAPPPPSPCGCGGRKKRSLPEKPTLFGIAAGDDDNINNLIDFQNSFVFTVRADTVYCGARKNNHNCHAFSM
ncbi:hypothetical protein CRE_09204 [Caenorhabditis remanei]|uniref:Ground-like domain-containing protein n=1 Tax=Caenorhabditis remanei TaxID=31234 RepID=E3LHH3_CAERE|nr:hypothetical protein CRE_09204 [Caenorhabditis remanei]